MYTIIIIKECYDKYIAFSKYASKPIEQFNKPTKAPP